MRTPEQDARHRDSVVAFYCHSWERAFPGQVIGTSTTVLGDGAVLLEMSAHGWGGADTVKSALIVMPGGSPVIPVTVEPFDG